MIKAGLDIGNSKISCVIADYKNTENINILSIASVPNNNIKKNIILNFENLHDQIKSLVIEAEKQSQTKLNSINLNLSLLNSNSHYYNSAIELKNEKISELHLKKIINQSEYFNNHGEQFEIFNNITSYDIDNNLYFNAPIGNYSDNIKINFYKINIQKKCTGSFTPDNFKGVGNAPRFSCHKVLSESRMFPRFEILSRTRVPSDQSDRGG